MYMYKGGKYIERVLTWTGDLREKETYMKRTLTKKHIERQ